MDKTFQFKKKIKIAKFLYLLFQTHLNNLKICLQLILMKQSMIFFLIFFSLPNKALL